MSRADQLAADRADRRAAVPGIALVVVRVVVSSMIVVLFPHRPLADVAALGIFVPTFLAGIVWIDRVGKRERPEP